MWAVQQGNREISKLLISRRADVNARDEGTNKYTPIFYAMDNTS